MSAGAQVSGERHTAGPLFDVVSRDYIPTMKAVGIRELKARLSHYLGDVQGGEVVLVTDRGRVVAEVRPPGRDTVSPESATERALRRLSEEGGLLIGEPHDPGAYAASPLRMPEGTAALLLAEERA